MRSEASEATYVEFATARLEELRRIALEAGDKNAVDDVLGETLVRLYVAWPQLEHDGTEETFARDVVVETARRRSRRAFSSSGPTVADSLMAGRNVVRRRRRRALWSTTVGSLVLVACAPLLLPRATGPGAGGGEDITPPPAPARVAPQGTVHLLTAPAKEVRADTPPVLYLFGRLFRRDRGVTVLATYGEIDHARRPQGGAIVRTRGRTLWVVVAGNGPESLVGQRAAPYDYPAFMAWARSMIS